MRKTCLYALKYFAPSCIYQLHFEMFYIIEHLMSPKFLVNSWKNCMKGGSCLLEAAVDNSLAVEVSSSSSAIQHMERREKKME